MILSRLLSPIPALCVTTVLATAAFASEPVERTNTTALWFESWGKLTNATLTVVNPEGQQFVVYAESNTPVFRLREAQPVIDGVYAYELTAATDEMITLKNPLNNGRGKAAKKQIPKSFGMGGFFFVTRGVINNKDKQLEEK